MNVISINSLHITSVMLLERHGKNCLLKKHDNYVTAIIICFDSPTTGSIKNLSIQEKI